MKQFMFLVITVKSHKIVWYYDGIKQNKQEI